MQGRKGDPGTPMLARAQLLAHVPGESAGAEVALALERDKAVSKGKIQCGLS